MNNYTGDIFDWNVFMRDFDFDELLNSSELDAILNIEQNNKKPVETSDKCIQTDIDAPVMYPSIDLTDDDSDNLNNKLLVKNEPKHFDVNNGVIILCDSDDEQKPAINVQPNEGGQENFLESINLCQVNKKILNNSNVISKKPMKKLKPVNEAKNLIAKSNISVEVLRNSGIISENGVRRSSRNVLRVPLPIKINQYIIKKEK